MKFTVNTRVLREALNPLLLAIDSRVVVPALENFLFQVEGRVARITSSNLSISMVTTVNIERSKTDRVDVCIPARILLDTLKSLEDEPVDFVFDHNLHSFEIISEEGRYKMATVRAADYPKLPVPADSKRIEISKEELMEAIHHTSLCVSTDVLRPAMCGIYAHGSNGRLVFASTDGHRLSKFVTDAHGMEDGIIIPKKAMTILQVLLKDCPTESVELKYSSMNLFVEVGDTMVIARLIDERFPAYESVIPTEHSISMVVNRHSLVDSLKRISLYANRSTSQIQLVIIGDGLRIESDDADFGKEAEEALIIEHSGDDMTIGFNARLLLELTQNHSSESLVMKFTAPNKACIIQVPEKKDSQSLVMLMPVMLNQTA
ncbi:MAG: DNA polymerase III subunit beta [Cyclobacteriaceae bacterium]